MLKGLHLGRCSLSRDPIGIGDPLSGTEVLKRQLKLDLPIRGKSLKLKKSLSEGTLYLPHKSSSEQKVLKKTFFT